MVHKQFKHFWFWEKRVNIEWYRERLSAFLLENWLQKVLRRVINLCATCNFVETISQDVIIFTHWINAIKGGIFEKVSVWYYANARKDSIIYSFFVFFFKHILHIFKRCVKDILHIFFTGALPTNVVPVANFAK